MAPTEDDYVRYIFYLRTVKKFQVSSLWSHYSRLNNNHQRRFGSKLQQWPRITNMIKGYASGYQRKSAGIFSREEMEAVIQLPNDSITWILWKAVVSVAFLGGLRGIELRSITFGNVTVDDQGCWVDYYQAKRKGEEKVNGFLGCNSIDILNLSTMMGETPNMTWARYWVDKLSIELHPRSPSTEPDQNFVGHPV